MVYTLFSLKTVQRKKLTITFFSAAFIGVIYVLHQFLSVNQIEFYASNQLSGGKANIIENSPVKHEEPSPLQSDGSRMKYSWLLNGDAIRGIKRGDRHLYNPNASGNFVCLTSRKEIKMDRINDDFCDCPADGSDEPGTSACSNGVFYCYSNNFVSIPSGRVNDGICDCCDGSDEWLNVSHPSHIKGNRQKQLGIFMPPCPNTCPDKLLK
ncbi:uncharacterized protein LOC124163553 [Ischnura elegans]|uniref:uncharacterized protein LOC124163553 n=1 Tax=Ischnura elegans TaxID=197161 RepID=UPI001ED86AFB|nr:uncharacterized protein LOC124163553 [Ischnura elegans]